MLQQYANIDERKNARPFFFLGGGGVGLRALSFLFSSFSWGTFDFLGEYGSSGLTFSPSAFSHLPFLLFLFLLVPQPPTNEQAVECGICAVLCRRYCI